MHIQLTYIKTIKVSEVTCRLRANLGDDSYQSVMDGRGVCEGERGRAGRETTGPGTAITA